MHVTTLSDERKKMTRYPMLYVDQSRQKHRMFARDAYRATVAAIVVQAAVVLVLVKVVVVVVVAAAVAAVPVCV